MLSKTMRALDVMWLEHCATVGSTMSPLSSFFSGPGGATLMVRIVHAGDRAVQGCRQV